MGPDADKIVVYNIYIHFRAKVKMELFLEIPTELSINYQLTIKLSAYETKATPKLHSFAMHTPVKERLNDSPQAGTLVLICKTGVQQETRWSRPPTPPSWPEMSFLK